jgi:hypothetical protein
MNNFNMGGGQGGMYGGQGGDSDDEDEDEEEEHEHEHHHHDGEDHSHSHGAEPSKNADLGDLDAEEEPAK